MPKTSDYLNDLKNQKTSLAKCLKRHDVDSSEQETFSTLVPKTVDYIDSNTGSGVTLSDLALLSDGGNVAEPGKDDYLNDLTYHKNSLAETLQEAGVEASTEETFSTLVPKVGDCIEESQEFWNALTDGGVTASYLFENCTWLKVAPKLVFTGTQAWNMFKNCSALEDVSAVSMMNLTEPTGMFSWCGNLNPNRFPQWNPKIFRSCNTVFQGSRIESVPDMDLLVSNSIQNICLGCKSLQTVGRLKTPNVIQFMSAFDNCINLTTIEEIDFTRATGLNGVFTNCNSLENITVVGTIPISLSFSYSPLNLESAKSVITALKDYSGTANEYRYTISFSPTTMAYLEAEGATAPNGLTWTDYAMNKGWNI